MFVLGIDPGLSRCGYGAAALGRDGAPEVRAYGVIRTAPAVALPHRLATLAAELRDLLAELRPDAVAVERVFFQTNVRTAMSVAQASGLALALSAEVGCIVAEYTPNEVKSVVTGYGSATKQQVQRMVQAQLKLSALPSPPDAADALALALTHLALAPRRARLAAAR